MAPPSKKRPDTGELLRRWEADKKSRNFLQLAEEYRKTDFVDAALSVLRDGLKHHPNFQPAHVALARCFMAKRQWTEAQAELERVHAKSPDNLLAGKLLVEVLEGRGEKSQALEVARSLVPFAAFDDPEVEATAKRLEAELAGPKVRALSGSTGTGSLTGGDTMDFGASESAGDSTQDLPVRGAPAEVEEEPILLDADAFAEDEEEGEPGPPPAAAGRSPFDDDEGVVDSLDADSTHDELGIDATHDELAAVSDSPFAEMPLPPAPPREEAPEDLLGTPAPQVVAGSTGAEDDLTSITLAELYEAQDSPREAAEIYEKLLARRPDDAGLRAAFERCRARIESRLTGETTVADAVKVVAAGSPPDVPVWEPAPVMPTPAPVAPPAKTSSAAGASPAQLKALLSEYERWLTAVRAVRH